MEICHPHNLNASATSAEPRFGIRVTATASDPFRKLVGPDWEKFHWYEAAEERDAAMADMSQQHLYSRSGDLPSLIFEPVER